MNPASFVFETATEARQLVRARVLEVRGDSAILCTTEDGSRLAPRCCKRPTAPASDLPPMTGSWSGWPMPTRRKASSSAALARRRPAAKPAAPPAELVIEATSQLTLKCGDGSITLRGDGKVLIKGKDLVSHAQRMNRIKGGGVAIN